MRWWCTDLTLEKVSWVAHQSSGRALKQVMLSRDKKSTCWLLTNNSHHSTWLEGLSWLTDGFHKSHPSFYMGSKKATRTFEGTKEYNSLVILFRQRVKYWYWSGYWYWIMVFCRVFISNTLWYWSGYWYWIMVFCRVLISNTLWYWYYWPIPRRPLPIQTKYCWSIPRRLRSMPLPPIPRIFDSKYIKIISHNPISCVLYWNRRH